jgi:TonB dependent receptor/Carboxypeptidase regulatory-like domain/TonB-dependent Receptor Plug Domain
VTRIAGVLLCVIGIAAGALAQTALEGTVQSRTGNKLAGAQVTITHLHGGAAAETSTSSQGEFQITNIEAGAYEVKVTHSGYASSQSTVVLRPREPMVLTVELKPSTAVRETVEVRSDFNVVDAEKTGSSQVFTRQQLERLPTPMTRNTTVLATNLMPGTTQSHDNFINVRGNEFSLHQFINGVSFLDNEQQQFSPGLSPRIFETVDLLTGGFAAEYGNRFGGVMDITTRSGRSLGEHGSVEFSGLTNDNYDLTADVGGVVGKVGYYFFGEGFTSGRYLDPPTPEELFDRGHGLRGAAQLDWQGTKNSVKLMLLGGGTHLQQPNIPEDQEAGRDATRNLGSQTSILTWTHTFSPSTLWQSSLYERVTGDRINPTSDPDTPLSIGSRSTLTGGIKTDVTRLWHGHVFKGGVDLVRLREKESFFIDGRGDPDVFPIDFNGTVTGGQASAYLQDHFHVSRNLTMDTGVRYDYFNLIDTQAQISPRFGLAYNIAVTKSVLHASYNRLMSPPPIEYSLLASFIGNNSPIAEQRVGNVRAYKQNYFEVGWAQELQRNFGFELNGWLHTGRNSFENHEISISRLFLPINFFAARSTGLDFVLNMRPLERYGITGRLTYTAQRTFFYGPTTGGFTGDEPLAPGERIIPAFDETHVGSAYLIYNKPRWRGFWAASNMRYGSGSKPEQATARLPQHFTTDLASGITVWNSEPRRVELQFNVTNVSDSRYQIAKESEEIPIQFAQSRTVGGSLKFHF